MRALLVLLVALPIAVFAQTPPDIQAIMDKARGGQAPTPEEMQRLHEWSSQLQQNPSALQQSAMQQHGGVPPELIPIFQKRHRGEALTADEQQKLDAFMRSRMQQQAAPGPDGKVTVSQRAMAAYFATEGAVPQASSVDVSKRARLDRKGYLALVTRIRADAKKALGDPRAAALDQAAGKDPRRAQALGALLSAMAFDPGAGAYVLAGLALRQPGDPRTALNLSVAAYNGNYFVEAYDLATYGDALEPGSASALCNRAWPAMYLGDFKTAGSLFDQAVGKAQLAEAYSGKALIAKAQGDQQQMLMMAGKALAHGTGSFVDQAIEADGHRGETDEQRARDTPIADEGGGSAGGIVYDLSAKSSLNYPVWTVPAKPEAAVMLLPDYQQWVAQMSKRIVALGKEKTAKEQAYVAAHDQKVAQGTAHWPRHNPRILTVLGDLQDVYWARVQLVKNDWEKKYPKWITEMQQQFNDLASQEAQAMKGCGQKTECEKKVAHEYCLKRHAAGRSLHAGIGDDYGHHVTQTRDLMEEFWKKSQPYVDGIADPDQQEIRVLERRNFLYASLIGIRQGVTPWLAGIEPFVGEQCVDPGPPPKKDDVNKEADEGTPKKHDCGHGHCGLMAVDLSWDCHGFTIQGGEGLFAGVTVKFAGADGTGTRSGHTETTVFAGVGAEESYGSYGKGEAKAVISFTQAQGQVVDVGAGFSTDASISGFGSKAETGTDLSWSMRDGANMDWKADASWQGHELGGAHL